MICNAKLGTQLLTGTMTLFATPWGSTPHRPEMSHGGQQGVGRSLPRTPARVRHWSLAGVMALAVLGVMPPAALAFSRTEQAPQVVSAGHDLGLSQLPVQGQEMYRRIHAGGPFRYDKDGVVFGNREARLPRKPRGFYREYTVPTPGSRNRGARRIVCGGEVMQKPETCFYTQDHYQSFQKIDPTR